MWFYEKNIIYSKQQFPEEKRFHYFYQLYYWLQQKLCRWKQGHCWECMSGVQAEWLKLQEVKWIAIKHQGPNPDILVHCYSAPVKKQKSFPHSLLDAMEGII